MRTKVYITDKNCEDALENGICKKTLVNRINTLGWSMEEATTKRVNERKEYLKRAEENGISQPAYDGRVYNLGWSKERACTQKYFTTLK